MSERPSGVSGHLRDQGVSPPVRWSCRVRGARSFERFHEILKLFLAKQDRPATLAELHEEIDPGLCRGPPSIRDKHDRRQGVAAIPHATTSLGIGKAHKGKRVIMLIDDLDIRVLDEDGEVLRELVLDPSKDYQGTGRPTGHPKDQPWKPDRRG